jgi:hypothetical protein
VGDCKWKQQHLIDTDYADLYTRHNNGRRDYAIRRIYLSHLYLVRNIHYIYSRVRSNPRSRRWRVRRRRKRRRRWRVW